MQPTIKQVLPKTASEITNGGVYRQHIRCGKKNCKCARGETHLAYYFFTRRCGKLTKIYIRKSDVKAFTKIANQAASGRAQKRLSVKESNKLFRRLRESVREYEQQTKLNRENYNE